ncbi:PucR C-terminal helix-turn-helix domain-containing protein [Amycolatopsis pretoriensis]|uniref:PucR C-terminal helix-turn-helix domain-containing protein n=1 Tax=Amycolatopsis pretoriensis TaxID=218821 RepID=A0A1H5Q4K6_9PSEU|nr:helix-turn-helix domain-containing protein [Amycolatopsis pretoriensis]SEF21060.1 PucR C-terminal helix-turn-helix domain-containing protein [Amycolatopsis pretoriensis]
MTPLLRRILDELAADETVLDELVKAARSESPEVARLPEAENRRHIQVLLSAALRATASPDGPAREDYTTAEALGADRAAQGVPLTGLLRGVQAGRTHAARVAVARARAAGVPDELILETVLDADRYTGALEHHIVKGYHAAELQLSRTVRDARTQLLRTLLLSGHPPTPEELRRAGLHPDVRYFCVVSDVSDPAQARTLEQALLAFGGVYGLVEGRLTGLAVRSPAGVALFEGASLVVAPPAALPALREVHRLCTAAARIAGPGYHDVTALAGEIALTAQPLLADLLTTALLGALDPANPFHRELAATALAYLDHGQRLRPTAEALHLHPNTVRYRLDRLAELTPLPWAENTGGRVLDAVRSWWALHHWLTASERP